MSEVNTHMHATAGLGCAWAWLPLWRPPAGLLTLSPAPSTPAELARRELAPLALHAYCEAYSDFKRCMVSLVAGGSGSSNGSGGSSGSGSGGGSPAGAAAGPSAELAEFAGMVARAARQEAVCGGAAGGSEAQAPPAAQLLQLLRYLLLLHQHQVRRRGGVPGTRQQLVEPDASALHAA